MNHRVFVYGSLLAGLHNHRLLHSARFVAPGETRPEYEMRSLGGFPGVLAGGSTTIVGEVYAVDDDTLRQLDRLEGHPHFYKRTATVVRIAGAAHWVWMYQLVEPRPEAPLVTSGNWRRYRYLRDCGGEVR